VGTLVMECDGSYMVELARNTCLAAYIIKCTAAGNEVRGIIVKRSDAADNHRPKTLGALMSQLVLRAATGGKYLPYQEAEVFCDNRGVVSHGNSSKTVLPEK